MKHLEILLVEDSPSDVRLIREALKETAAEISLTVARDGVEAMERLQASLHNPAQRPDLMLLDLNLPRKNGREVLAEVKASPEFQNIPILVMTSSHAEDDVQAAYALNANCYITKPSDLEAYINVVRAIQAFWFMTATLPRGVGSEASTSDQRSSDKARMTSAGGGSSTSRRSAGYGA